MRTVRIDITAPDDNELKVVWNDPEAPWSPYYIHRKLVATCTNRIRAALARIVDQALAEAAPGGDGALRELAKAGHDLHRALFKAAGEGSGDPEEIRQFYASQPDCRFRFRLPPGVDVPWGLTYPGPIDQLPDAFDAAACEPFWCLLRQAATQHLGLKPNVVGQVATDLGLVRVTQTTAFEKALAGLDDEERAFLQFLEGRFGAAVSTRDGLEQVWKTKGAQAGMLYFYCHANAAELAVDEDEPLTANDLLLSLERPKGQSGCLVLLYGCSTAVGASEGGFLASASQPGFCGFVGTETEVPDVFALRFGLRLIHRLFTRNETLGEAMQALVRRHLPLSLLFSVYAHPDFRMPVPGIAVTLEDADLNATPGEKKI